MVALPVIERELRQQSRRASGKWVRVAAAFLAGGAAVMILGATPAGRVGGLMPGQVVFTTLSVFVFVFCLFEGVRQTADALAGEKREGTLGLLLLTDLKGLDVVLGKLAAGSLGSIYALLAVFPAMSMALPYGGVTAGEFWRTQLVLIDALFLALAVGLWSSATEREAGRALAKGLTVIAVLTLVPMMIEVFLQRGPLPNISPAIGLYLARATVYPGEALRFWLTLLAIQGLAWGALALAGRRLVRSWQDEDRPATLASLMATPAPAERWAPEGEPVWTEDLSAYRTARPGSERPERELIDRDAAAWLAAWVPQHRFLAGAAIFLLGLGSFGGIILSPVFGLTMIGLGPGLVIGWLTALLPWLLLAYLACQPLAEARRSGALELLLSTPLTPEAIVRAHWKGLWFQLRGPVLVACAIIGVVILFAIATALADGLPPEATSIAIARLLGCVSRVAIGIAVCRVGLYFGLRARTMFAAVAQTLLVSVVAISLGSILAWLTVAALPFGTSLNWTRTILPEALTIGYAVFLVRWSDQKLIARFRELSARAG